MSRVSFPQVLSSRLDTPDRVAPLRNSERLWYTVIDKPKLAFVPRSEAPVKPANLRLHQSARYSETLLQAASEAG